MIIVYDECDVLLAKAETARVKEALSNLIVAVDLERGQRERSEEVNKALKDASETLATKENERD